MTKVVVVFSFGITNHHYLAEIKPLNHCGPELRGAYKSKGYIVQSLSTYVKGSLYTKFDEFIMPTDSIPGFPMPSKRKPDISFNIENGDVKRIAGSKATKVDF